MVLDRASGRVTHRTFRDLSELLRPGDALVLNKTRVMPARFSARRRTGGRLSGLFLGEAAPGRLSVLVNRPVAVVVWLGRTRALRRPSSSRDA